DGLDVAAADLDARARLLEHDLATSVVIDGLVDPAAVGEAERPGDLEAAVEARARRRRRGFGRERILDPRRRIPKRRAAIRRQLTARRRDQRHAGAVGPQAAVCYKPAVAIVHRPRARLPAIREDVGARERA